MPPRVIRIVTTVLVSCSLVFALAYWAGFIPRKAERKGWAMAEQITQHVKQPGNWMRVDDIHPGEWTTVCVVPSMSTGGAYSISQLERQFKVMPPNTIRFPNGIAAASDWHWVLLFFYPPNTVEMFAISTDSMLGSAFAGSPDNYHGFCRSRVEAILYWKAAETDPLPYMILLNEDQLQQLKALEEQ